MTIEQLAKRALQIQDASNPSGVALALVDAIAELRKLGYVGTQDICDSPIVQLMAHKLADLCGGMATWDSDRYQAAYDGCQHRAAYVLPECTTCQEHGSGACYSLGAGAEHQCCNN